MEELIQEMHSLCKELGHMNTTDTPIAYAIISKRESQLYESLRTHYKDLCAIHAAFKVLPAPDAYNVGDRKCVEVEDGRGVFIPEHNCHIPYRYEFILTLNCTTLEKEWSLLKIYK